MHPQLPPPHRLLPTPAPRRVLYADSPDALVEVLRAQAEAVPVRAVDNGIGPYECYGVRGVHTNWELEPDPVVPFRVIVAGCDDDGADTSVEVTVERDAGHRHGRVEGSITLVAKLVGYADGRAMYDVRGA